MKITTGTARGRQIKMPKGAQVRPTSDKVKQALFNRLGSVANLKVLDLFCGSGALGLECLSRNAEWVTFVDKDRRCIDSVSEHCKKFNFDHLSWAGLVLDWQSAISNRLTGDPFDLVFLDPPYQLGCEKEILSSRALAQLCSPKARLSLEHSAKIQLPRDTALWTLADTAVYGDTSLSLFEKSVEQEAAHA